MEFLFSLYSLHGVFILVLMVWDMIFLHHLQQWLHVLIIWD